jgi:16S rRNA (cytosine1402-N4)-methyltransferase
VSDIPPDPNPADPNPGGNRPFEHRPFEHRPVMVDEVVELFGPVPEGPLVDATVGGGGHAEALLEQLPHLSVVGLDRDLDAVEAARRRLGHFGDRARVVHARFDRLGAVVADLGLGQLSGVLFDLGVSSPQLDRDERGFSYRAEVPLDMRMDRTQTLSAAEVVNTYDERRLARLLRQYGDEAQAGRIARAIVRHRPVTDTAQLAEIVRDAIPAALRRHGRHPARRSFQAIRIEVNGELDVLPPALDAALDATGPAGRIAVLAYHSGEDRLVKSRFRQAVTGGCTCPPRLPCVCGARARVRLLTRGARRPTAEEIATNPRSEAARMRALELLP